MLILSKKATIFSAFDAQKLDAIQMYAAQKNIDFEAELVDFLEKKYQRIVPQQVRKYIAESSDLADLQKRKRKKSIPKTDENPSSSNEKIQGIPTEISLETDGGQASVDDPPSHSW